MKLHYFNTIIMRAIAVCNVQSGLESVKQLYTLNVIHDCGQCGDSATVQSSNSPSAKDDYIPRAPFEITFPPGSRRQVYNVTIADDNISENSEFFNADVSLATPEDTTMIKIEHPKQPVIEILDLVDRE